MSGPPALFLVVDGGIKLVKPEAGAGLRQGGPR